MLAQLACFLVCARVQVQQIKHEQTAQVTVRQNEKYSPIPSIQGNSDIPRNDISNGDKEKQNTIPTNGSTASTYTVGDTSVKNEHTIYSYRVSPSTRPVAEAIDKTFGNQAESAKELFFKESGLRPTAVNRSSGASGLVQSLPASKLHCGLSYKQEDVECQVTWGFNYIKNRYKTADRALQHELAEGWY